MLATDPYHNGYGLRIPRGEIFSSVINHVKNSSNEVNKAWKILDIGCGLGANARILEFFPNSIYVGIDLSQTAIDRALKSLNDSHAAIEFVCQDTLKFLRESNYLPDLVIDSASLQHHLDPSNWQSQVRFFDELSQLLPSSTIFTQWASSTNSEMTKNFVNFVGYEDIEKILRRFFLVTPYSIIETTYPGRVSSEGIQMRIKEFVSILKQKPQNQ